MKNRLTLIFASLMISGTALAGWVTDEKANFKINVPDDWQRTILQDGADRIHVFLSPDENLAVRVRSFAVNDNVSLDLIISLFESNILSGGNRLALVDHTLKTYKGKVGAYEGTFNTAKVGAAAFFTIQNGRAYIIWSMVPANLFDSRIDESDAVTNTFTLLSGGGSGTVSGRTVQTFADDGLGYEIDYPAGWVYSKTRPHIVIFSGREGTPAYYSTVNIQNLASTLMGGNFNTLTDVLNHFQRQLFNGAEDIVMSGVSNFTFKSSGRTCEGEEITATYQRQGERFKQRLIVIPRHDQKLFYAWMYTAPLEDYDTFLPRALEMLNSWRIR